MIQEEVVVDIVDDEEGTKQNIPKLYIYSRTSKITYKTEFWIPFNPLKFHCLSALPKYTTIFKFAELWTCLGLAESTEEGLWTSS